MLDDRLPMVFRDSTRDSDITDLDARPGRLPDDSAEPDGQVGSPMEHENP